MLLVAAELTIYQLNLSKIKIMYNIFVYGTLKKGGSNHHFLESSEFLRDDVLEDHSIYVPSVFSFLLIVFGFGGGVGLGSSIIFGSTPSNLTVALSKCF